jgi:predicted dehydrogenase
MGKVHALAHRMLPALYWPATASTRLVGVCTRSPERQATAMAQCGFEFATADLDALLARSDIDLIHICTPNDVHYSQVKAALQAGKHVYCDKPLALNPAQAEELCALAAGSGRAAQVTFNYRFVPALMRARVLAETGFLGDLYGFRAAYLHAGYTDPARPYAWRTNLERSGGGAIMDLGSHVFDLVRYLTGPGLPIGRAGDIETVSATMATLIDHRRDPVSGEMRKVDVDDIAWVTCRLAGGAVGTVEATRLATGAQDELRIEVHGSRGALRFNLMDPNWLDAYDATEPESALGGERGFKRIECATRYPSPYAMGGGKSTVGWMSFHAHSVFDFVCNAERVEAGGAMSVQSPGFGDGLQAQKAIAASQESARNQGAWTPLA